MVVVYAIVASLVAMRGACRGELPLPRQDDLQRVVIHRPGHEPMECHAQRAMWNAEQSGKVGMREY
eukprot:102970-Amphidinium_carterae.1